MPADTTIHPFPELRALAEEEAYHRRRRLFAALTAPGRFFGSELRASVPDITFWIEAVTAELCDLTRPASRDAVCRLVGERIGWDGHSVALSVETGGVNVYALFRDCGIAAEPSLNAAADLALIVRHLWPKEQP